MSIDSITNNSTTLYSPVPASELQNNLAHFYQKTSSFVEEQFEKMIEDQNLGSPAKEMRSLDNDEEISRLNPQGMGTLVDLYA